MDSSEQLVEIYLRSLGYSEIVYEPDGNVPPDFLVNKRIAVEVRRLNQNVKSVAGDTQGIEETFIPIWQAMHRYLPTLGPSMHGESWFVGIRIRRPLEPWRALKPLIRSALQNFMQSTIRQATTIAITRHFELSIRPAGTSFPSFFLLGTGLDFDAGGFVVAQVMQNLTLCIAEKERKIFPYKHKYPEWWLILPDHIGHALDADDQQQFRSLPPLIHSWNKVILLNPNKPSYAFEI